MSNAKFDTEVNIFFDQVDEGLRTYVPDMVAETATEFFKESFVTKSWDGIPWQEYKNKAKEPKRGTLMRRANNLVNSIRPTVVSITLVRINAGSDKVPYARTHNEGEHMKGTRNIRQYYNNNFMGTGKRVAIRAHTRSVDYLMPKRQFMGKNQPLINTIKTRFNNNFKTNLK